MCGHYRPAMPKVSRRSAIAPFYAMEISALAHEHGVEGADVLHLEVGEPSGGAPLVARQAASRALLENRLGYTPSLGNLALRCRIARHYDDWYGLSVDPRRVIVTAGASGGFVLAFLACFDEGARVGVTEPGYPCYRNTLEALGVTPVGIPLDPATDYRLTPELIEAAGPLDGLVIASPSNPTGTVISAADLEAIGAHTTSRGITLIADEIYHGITYTGPASTVLASTPGAIVLNSFSKYFGMTGWRLGWIIAPDALVAPMERFAQNLYICAPHVSQVAGLAAFDGHDELEENVRVFARKRAVLLDGLRAAGFDRIAPADGAFYAYVDVSAITNDSWALCRTWLDELGIAATPGLDFDPVRGKQFVRFSCAGDEVQISEAVRRLAAWMAGRTAR